MPIVFKTDIGSEADLKVFVTDTRFDADLVAFETTDAWAATAATNWCYTTIRGEAHKVVHFVNARWEADLAVFWTDIQSDAGWVAGGKEHLL